MSAEVPLALGLLAAAVTGAGPAGRLREVLPVPRRPTGSDGPEWRLHPGARGGPAAPLGGQVPSLGGQVPSLGGQVPSPGGTPVLRPFGRLGSVLRRRASVAQLDSATVDVPLALSLELRAGRDLAAALDAVSVEQQGFPPLSARLRHSAAIARSGGDVSAALTSSAPLGRDPVSAALFVTAACCGSAASAGLPLADLLDAAGAAARAGVSLRGMARAELAASRSTAMVLAALPLAGVAMGQALGARPAAVLFGTVWGAGCLAAAAVLTVAGLLWTRAITAGLRKALP